MRDGLNREWGCGITLRKRSAAGAPASPDASTLAPLTLRSNTGAPSLRLDRSGLSPSDKVPQRNTTTPIL